MKEQEICWKQQEQASSRFIDGGNIDRCTDSDSSDESSSAFYVDGVCCDCSVPCSLLLCEDVTTAACMCVYLVLLILVSFPSGLVGVLAWFCFFFHFCSHKGAVLKMCASGHSAPRTKINSGGVDVVTGGS